MPAMRPPPPLLTMDRDRLVSALAVAAIHVALGWALLTGLGANVPQLLQQPLAAFDVTTPPPPRPPVTPPRQKPRTPERSGRASPPNLMSVATPVVAPLTPIPIPPPVVTAPIARTGDDPTAGAAPVVGPGYGAGGVGDGTGSGGYGDGPGGGGGGGRPARLIKRGLGSLSCDTPEDGCPSREVGIRFTVGTNGRATGCIVTATSGDRRTDMETCRRIEQKLRYDPARDHAGRKIVQVITGSQYWDSVVAEPDEPDPKN